MHIYDKETNFQGGWALVAEQLPYATGAAKVRGEIICFIPYSY